MYLNIALSRKHQRLEHAPHLSLLHLSLPPLPSPLVMCTSSSFATSLTLVSITPQPQQNGITTDPSALPNINVAKVRQKIHKNVAERRREIDSRGVNVSEEAQQLISAIFLLFV